jgi:hypothetical protein
VLLLLLTRSKQLWDDEAKKRVERMLAMDARKGRGGGQKKMER